MFEGGGARSLAGWMAAGVLALLMAPVVGSPTVRAAYVRQFAIERARVIRPTLVMLGDSLTAKGEPWGLRLGHDPLAVIVFARGGNTLYQIDGLTDEARRYHPRYVHILAGTNDILLGERDVGAFLRRFAHMLDRMPKDATLLVTLIPPTQFREASDRARRFNLALIPLLRRRHVRIIDPWARMTRDGVIDKPYTVDGVHLSEAGYRIWQAAIKQAIRQP